MLTRNTDAENSPTLFVANIDCKVTRLNLKEVFQLAGNVISLEVLRNNDGRSRGMYTVTYAQSEQAALAI